MTEITTFEMKKPPADLIETIELEPQEIKDDSTSPNNR